MTQKNIKKFSYLGAFCVTGLLFFLLVFIELIFEPNIDVPTSYGAVKLSTFKDAPPAPKEPEVFTTKKIEMPEVEQLQEIDLQMEMPNITPALPSMRLDFAPELAGTVPMAGLPSVSDASSYSLQSGGALTLGQVDEMPRPIYAPEPQYPVGESGANATVTVKIFLETDGSVLEAVALANSGQSEAFVNNAVRVVKRWQFTPCKKSGKAVRCVAEQPFVFKKR